MKSICVFMTRRHTHKLHAAIQNWSSFHRSYTEVAEAKDYRWSLSALVAGVLTSFDLPDCYRELPA